MKEHPILFSQEMVDAILEGKTQTRRVVKPQPFLGDTGTWYPSIVPGDKRNHTGLHYGNEAHFRFGMPIDFCPYGREGDRLWVRESWRAMDDIPTSRLAPGDQIFYRADYPFPVAYGQKWKPSIHMPRWASRITLEIVRVRIERLQEITEQDAFAEGVRPSIVGGDLDFLKYRAGFQSLWNSINVKRGYGWDINPWVWVIEFRKVA